jgi:hypothetical protein
VGVALRVNVSIVKATACNAPVNYYGSSIKIAEAEIVIIMY